MDRRLYRLNLLSVALSIIFIKIQGTENASKSQKSGDILLMETSKMTTISSSHYSDQEFVAKYRRHPYTEAVTPTYDLTDLKERCPLADICMPKKGHNRTHSKNSCCLPCRCDSICRKIGNCCDRSEMEGYMCHLPRKGRTIVFQLRYFMVDTCLNNSTTDSCTRFDASPWGSLYPVYDPSTGVNYINANCAECNNAHSYIYWDLRLESIEVRWSLTHCLSLLTSGDNHGSCAISFTPPKEMDILRHACPHDNTISSCNVTGVWAVYDIELDKACQRWFSPILDMIGRITFANIYCALCNGYSSRLCSELAPDRTLAGPLYMVLDYRQVKNAIAQPVTTRIEGLKNERCGSFMVRHPTKVMFNSGKTSN